MSPEVPLSWLMCSFTFIYSVVVCVHIPKQHIVYFEKMKSVPSYLSWERAALPWLGEGFQEKGRLVWHQVHQVSRALTRVVSERCCEWVLGNSGPSQFGFCQGCSVDPVRRVRSQINGHVERALFFFFFFFVSYTRLGHLPVLRGADRSRTHLGSEIIFSADPGSKARWGE